MFGELAALDARGIDSNRGGRTAVAVDAFACNDIVALGRNPYRGYPL